jgi:hypothetical protein
MNKYRQTAADLDNCYEQAEPEALGEQIAAIALALLIATGIAAALVHWWSA